MSSLKLWKLEGLMKKGGCKPWRRLCCKQHFSIWINTSLMPLPSVLLKTGKEPQTFFFFFFFWHDSRHWEMTLPGNEEVVTWALIFQFELRRCYSHLDVLAQWFSICGLWTLVGPQAMSPGPWKSVVIIEKWFLTWVLHIRPKIFQRGSALAFKNVQLWIP